MANFSKELIGAARAYLDTPASPHKSFAGNCIEMPSERCFGAGAGPEMFDCSGLVLRAIADITGERFPEYPDSLRHVRDIWEYARLGERNFRVARLAVGSLLVTGRRYTIGGQATVFPGHIGIVTDLGVRGALPSFIHANPVAGRVEERPLRTLDTMMGCVEFAG